MKIIIGDEEIKLKKSDVVAARSAINTFIDAARENCSYSMYLTTLLMMYSKSVQMLNELEL